MAKFRIGQTVTYRGKSGVVDGVDRTPGMVDVKYDGRLVKRHRAEDLSPAARANPRVRRNSAPEVVRLQRKSRELGKLKDYFRWKAAHAAMTNFEKKKARFQAILDKEEKKSGRMLTLRDQRMLAKELGILPWLEKAKYENIPQAQGVAQVAKEAGITSGTSPSAAMAKIRSAQQRIDAEIAAIAEAEQRRRTEFDPSKDEKAWEAERSRVVKAAAASVKAADGTTPRSMAEKAVEDAQTALETQTKKLASMKGEEYVYRSQENFKRTGKLLSLEEERRFTNIALGHDPSSESLPTNKQNYALEQLRQYGRFYLVRERSEDYIAQEKAQAKAQGALTKAERALERLTPDKEEAAKQILAEWQQAGVTDAKSWREFKTKQAAEQLGIESVQGRTMAQLVLDATAEAQQKRDQYKKLKPTPTQAARGVVQRVRFQEKTSGFTEGRVSFRAYPDPPRFPVTSEGIDPEELCGNPIDSTIYILQIPTTQTRKINHIITDGDVDQAKEWWAKEKATKTRGDDPEPWPEEGTPAFLDAMKNYFKSKGFYTMYPRYKEVARSEMGKFKIPFTAEDVQQLKVGQVFGTKDSLAGVNLTALIASVKTQKQEAEEALGRLPSVLLGGISLSSVLTPRYRQLINREEGGEEALEAYESAVKAKKYEKAKKLKEPVVKALESALNKFIKAADERIAYLNLQEGETQRGLAQQITRVKKARKSLTSRGRLQISAKSRTQGLLMGGYLPRETYFFKNPDGKGYVAYVVVQYRNPAEHKLDTMFRPQFIYGSQKRLSPFFAWRRLYRGVDKDSKDILQFSCETPKSKEVGRIAREMAYRLRSLARQIQRLGEMASTGYNELTGQDFVVGDYIAAITRTQNALEKVFNYVHPLVFLRKNVDSTQLAGIDLMMPVALIDAVVSIPGLLPAREANPNLIPEQWFAAMAMEPFPLMEPNPARMVTGDIIANFDQLSSRETTKRNQFLAELRASGKAPASLRAKPLSCSETQKTEPDKLDRALVLIQMARLRKKFETGQGMSTIEALAELIASKRHAWMFPVRPKNEILAKRYDNNVAADTQQIIRRLQDADSDSQLFPVLPNDEAAQKALAAEFNKIVEDIDKRVKDPDDDLDEQYAQVLREALFEKKAKESALLKAKNEHFLEMALTARCRRSALFLFHALGGEDIVRKLDGAAQHLTAISMSAGEIETGSFREFQNKNDAAKLIEGSKYIPMSKREQQALFFYTFNPALAMGTQRLWNSGSLFPVDRDGRLTEEGMAMSDAIQSVGVYGEMLKATYEEIGLAEREAEDYREDMDDEDYAGMVENIYEKGALGSTDYIKVLVLLRNTLQKRMPDAYGAISSMQALDEKLGDKDFAKKLLRVINEVQKASFDSAKAFSRRGGRLFPYQDRTMTDKMSRQTLNTWAYMFLIQGDRAVNSLMGYAGTGTAGSLGISRMGRDGRLLRQNLASARQAAQNALYEVSAMTRQMQNMTLTDDQVEDQLIDLEEALYDAGLTHDAVESQVEGLRRKLEGIQRAGALPLESQQTYIHEDYFTGEQQKGISVPPSSPIAALDFAAGEAKELSGTIDSLLSRWSDARTKKTPKKNPSRRRKSRRPRRKRR